MSDLLVNVIALLSTLALGLSAGAVVAEGAVLVPFWRAQRPEEFLAWYRSHAALLVGFYGPLEIAAVGFAAAGLVVNGFHPVLNTAPLAGALALAVGVLVAFPLYFQKVNASFAAGTIELARVPDELRRWSRWHWGRTALAIGAFSCAALALRS